MRFIQLTDFHLTDPAAGVNAINGAAEHADMVARGMQNVAARFPNAEGCVVTGDLTDLGEIAAYRWLGNQLNTMPFPVHTLLGNHDERENYLKVFQNADENGFAQSAVRVGPAGAGGVTLITLDTFITGSHAGELCERRMEWLQKQLAKAGSDPVLLFMHHPPCEIGDRLLDPIRLRNSDAFYDVVSRAGNVLHIFCGHVHRNMFVNWRGIPVTSLDRPKVSDTDGKMPVAVIDVVGADLRVSYVTV